MASLAITVDEEKVKLARALWAGESPTECVPHGHFVGGIDIEIPFV